METGIHRHPAFVESGPGGSARAAQRCFECRALLCTDQSSAQGQSGFNQGLMKNGSALEILSGSGSCSAEHLCSLPSLRAAPSSLSLCHTSKELLGPWLQLLAAVQGTHVALALWLCNLQLLRPWLSSSTAVSMRCRTATAGLAFCRDC